MSLPPAQPAYILRGHTAQIHSTSFIRSNTRLVTGDADGWIVSWSLASKRAAAVWRAHEGAILACAEWGSNRLITHGKDNKLIVWKFTDEDEFSMSTALPVDDVATPRKQPWLLHVLHVNTLNFCSFAFCKAQKQNLTQVPGEKNDDTDELLIAVPNTMSSEAVDIFHIPSEKRIFTVSGNKSINTGMVMAVALLYQESNLTIVAGYESGHTMVTQQFDNQGWQILYMSQPHSQPILSLALSLDQSFYLTSSADATIAKHPIPTISRGGISTALASSGNFSRASKPSASGISLLSKEFGTGGSSNTKPSTPSKAPIEIQATPLKLIQTKHSGQQSLKVRSDGKIFATAGWDTKVRVYSLKTMKELAVLKWHKEGCYSVAFSTIIDGDVKQKQEEEQEDVGKKLIQKSDTLTVLQKRNLKATTTHWLAAGSKDGKVSLWDIY